MAVILAAAAVLSFDGLQGLALTVRIPDHLAWLLPIVVDAGAAVSCAVWLGGRSARDAARYAGRMTWALLAVTVLGNAGHLGMVAEGITPPWWVAVLVGAIPPAVVGAAVHLVVLLVRRDVGDVLEPIPAAEPVVEDEPVIEIRYMDEPAEEPAALALVEDDDDEDDLLPAVREWARNHDGTPSQRQIRAQFSVGAARARKLYEAVS